MTNRERRRTLKDAERQARKASLEEAVSRQAQGHSPRRAPLSTGCDKRRQRKQSRGSHIGHRPMQSKKGYLRPYYPWEKGWRARL